MKNGFRAAFFIFTLCIYLKTLCPTVSGGDAGELITVAATLGVAHPPGYPLYTLLGKLFTLIPHGSVAWRMNFFSAFCDSVAAVLLLLGVEAWTGSLWGGWVSASAFAFSPLIWKYAVTAEVFALNNLFAAGIIYLSIRYAQTPKKSLAYFAAFWLGLGLSHHQTFIFLALPFTIWIFWKSKKDLLQKKTIATLSGLFLLGLSPYLYLRWAGSREVFASWGDLSTWNGWIWHILRRDYGTFQLSSPIDQSQQPLFDLIWNYLSQLPKEFFYAGPLLAITGLMGLMKEKKPCTWLWFSSFLIYISVFFGFMNIESDLNIALKFQERFWQIPNLWVAMWIGGGAVFLSKKFKRLSADRLSTVSLIVLVSQIGLNYRSQDRSQEWIFFNYGKTILTPLPQNALLLAEGDLNHGVLIYLQKIEKIRPDLKILTLGLLKYPWHPQWMKIHFPDISVPEPFQMRNFLDANISRFNTFICNGYMEPDSLQSQAYRNFPFGLCEAIVPKYLDPSTLHWEEATRSALDQFKSSSPLGIYDETSWENQPQIVYYKATHNYSAHLLMDALSLPTTQDPIPRLKEVATRLTDLSQQPKYHNPSLFKNLGLAYLNLSQRDPSAADTYKKLMIQSWRTYLAQMPTSDPESLKIQALVEKAESAK